MKSVPCVFGGVIACAAMAAPCVGAVTPLSRLSSLDIYILCGNGPVMEIYDEAVTETGLLASGVVDHNKYVLFDDATWGSSDADVQMSQDIAIASNGAAGFRIDGALLPNSIALRSLAPSYLGASALANARTDSVFEYVFQVDAPTTWSIDVEATRNPTGWFAASLENITGGGYPYLNPFEEPIVDASNGVLNPGQYRLFVRQNTNGLTADADLADASTAAFSFVVGEVPAPGAIALVGLVAPAVVARRRR